MCILKPPRSSVAVQYQNSPSSLH
uniref:Uncharacterized protein n=1 Tax=Anguilla anguilla TaxID=7936 RepID=A0A0E9XGI9_ANGAN